MLTPAYALTATERVLPRLALDFTTGVLDPRVTITRALNTATRVNSSGLIEIVDADLPRFDYDPATLAPKGLLIEESRANKLLQSNGFTTSPWNYTGSPVVTANAAISPDGTSNAFQITSSPSGTFRVIFQDVATTAVAHTFSIYLKSATGTNQTMRIWVDTSPSVSAAITVTPQWQRFTVSGTTDTSARVQIGVDSSANAFDVYAYGAQLEAGAFATSYIPTTTTSLTRNADVVAMTGTNFSDWYNASEGTFAAQYSSIAATAATTKAIASANDGTGTNRIYMYITNTAAPAQLVIDGGATQANPLNTAIANNTVTKSVMGYKVNNFGIATNGAAAVVDTVGTVPNVNTLGIGSHTGIQQLNGWAQKLNYYPQKLTSAEIQAFSK